MCSTVLRANEYSASPISRRASSLRARTSSGCWTAPETSSSPPRQTSPPRTSIASPSLRASKARSSGRSTRWMPAWTSSSGPMFGYVPLDERRQLRTAATPAATRSSAETRSRSLWSMIAISPGARRLTISFVRRPRRTLPATVRASRRGCSVAAAVVVRGAADMRGESTPVREDANMVATRPFGVYVHVPFCAARCGYCDFNTYVGSSGDDHAAWADAAVAEIGLAARTVGAAGVDTVFFGGGTPTLVAPRLLARVLRAVDEAFGLAGGAEVTTEANPDSVDGAALRSLRQAGFTRVSLGMQSAVGHVLAVLDRRHDPERPAAAVAEARAARVEHVSLDLIYGTPGETAADWEASLDAVLAARADHVSAYALSVEPGTALAARVRRGAVRSPDPDAAADRYLAADEALLRAGLSWYEISNWAAG